MGFVSQSSPGCGYPYCLYTFPSLRLSINVLGHRALWTASLFCNDLLCLALLVQGVNSPIRTVIVSQGDVSDFHHIQGVVGDLIAVRIQDVGVFLSPPPWKSPAELPTVFWQTPRSCGNLIAVRIHISEFTRRNRFKIQCLIPFWALPNTVTLYFGVIYILFLKCWKVFKRTILHDCSTTATGSRKRRKAQTFKWVFIMAAAGMQYNFKMCIINRYITYNYIQL